MSYTYIAEALFGEFFGRGIAKSSSSKFQRTVSNWLALMQNALVDNHNPYTVQLVCMWTHFHIK